MDWILGKLKSLVITIAGTAAVLAWWTIGGGGGGDVVAFTPDELPAVAGGGGHAIEVQLSTSQPATFSVSFGCADGGDGLEESGGAQQIEPGDHTFTFDVAGGCEYAILEAGVQEPAVGASLSWSVRVDGEDWAEEQQVLDAPLRDGYGFFLQTGWEDATLDEVLAYHRGA